MGRGQQPQAGRSCCGACRDHPEANADLVVVSNRVDLDPITQGAIAPAQFETIHPFADGNGRIGRVLIGWIVMTRMGIGVPPPVSLQIARDIGGYQAGLTLYREEMVEPWVRWFAEAMERSAEDSNIVMGLIEDIQAAWREQAKDLRSDSAGRPRATTGTADRRHVSDRLRPSRGA